MDPIREEMEHLVEQIFTATEQLREVAGDGKATRQFLDSIFRNVHSLKAAAASHDIETLTQIAHEFENLLHALRTGKARLDDKTLKAFDDTAHAMFDCLRQTEPLNSRSLNDLFSRLSALCDDRSSARRVELAAALNSALTEIWQSLSEEERHHLEQSIAEGTTLFLVNTSFDLVNFDQLFHELRAKLTEVGEIISTAPRVHDEHPEIDFRILYATDLDLARLQSQVAPVETVTVSELAPQLTTANVLSTYKPPSKAPTDSSSSQLIRINLDDLDRLISSTHQLFRDTHQCLEQLIDASTTSLALKEKVSALDASFLGLAADLVNLRMVPIDRVLQRALRAGRSVAAAAGKEIAFNVLGHDLKIDKSLADAIADPLIHVVRNAVDHGIETESERIATGKNRRGTISIEATASEGQTRIRVVDDGRGIDPARVQKAGRRLGVLTDDREIDMEKCLRLIFRSGFTTAKTISETSGRGIGLDVVESSIEAVGGAIKVNSTPGAGSVFEIRLPVTFSLLDVLTIKVGGFRYLIDAAKVIPSEMTVGHDKSIPLETLLGSEALESGSTSLLDCGDDQFAVSIHTDDPLETEQVLVRNLGSHGGRWVGVSGAAELRDGSVALLLDLPALLARYRYVNMSDML